MAKIGGHGKPLSLIIWFRVSHKLAKGQGMHGNTLFDQSKEKHAPMRGLAPVEPEREFVEIGLQVIFFESALMRPHQPSFNRKRSIKPPLSMFLKSGAYILLSKGEMLYEGFEYGGCKGGVDRSH